MLKVAELCECPTCGLRVPVRIYPMRCRCGTEVTDPRHNGPIVEIDRAARMHECRQCEQYHNRCDLIDLGCRRTFIQTLNDPEGKCPLGLWKDVVMIEPTQDEIASQFCSFERRSSSTVKCSRCKKVMSHTGRPEFAKSICLIQSAGEDITDTNLIYHVCALKSNDHWQDNIDQLVRRWRVFTQRKIIAVAVGDGMHSANRVRMNFPQDAEFIEVPNDTHLREVASFLPLLKAIKATTENTKSVTFYAHTKGNSTADGEEGAKLWRNAMYHHLLDFRLVAMDLLQVHPCVGTTKIVWAKNGVPPYPSRLMHGNWMFAGTFFWFRNDVVFNHERWSDVPDDRYGAEAWLSGMFEARDGATVYQPWPVYKYPTPNPYSVTSHMMLRF